MSETARWAELLAPRHAAATVALSLGVGLFAFNSFFTATALPTAVDALEGVTLISWAVSLYLVFAIVGGAAAAGLKARFGSRPTLVGAALVFLAGSAISGLATGMVPLLAGRAVAGIGEGVVAALCYALIPELFPSRLVPKVFGAEAMVWAAAAFGGPVVAGILTEVLSWRAAFLVNVPLALVFVALIAVVAPSGGGVANAARGVPLARLALTGAGVVAIGLASLAEGLAGPALIAAAAALLVAAVRLDRRAVEPVLPAGAFTFAGPIALGLWVVFLMPVAQAAAAVYLVLALQSLWDFGPGAAGAIAAVMAVAWSGSAIAVATVVGPRGHLAAVRAGAALNAVGLALLAAAVAGGMLPLVFAAQVATGVGFGIAWGFLSQFVMESAPPADRDRASALLPTLQSAGYAVGAAVAGVAGNAAGLVTGAPDEVVRHAVAVAFLAATVIALVPVGAALALSRRPRMADAPAA